MPLDFGLLDQGPRINTPFENLSQMLQVRQQQDSARGLAEQRQAIAEQRRAQTDALQRDAEREARLTELFSTNPKPTRADIMKADPSENGQKIATAIDALQDADLKRYKDQRAVTKEAIAGLNALPETMRPNGYGAIRQTFIARGWATPEDIPEQYDPTFVAGIQKSLLTPEKQYDINNPKPPADYNLGDSRMSGATNQPLATAAPKVPEPPKLGSLEDFIVSYATTRRLKPEQLSAGDKLKAKAQYEAAGRTPTQPREDKYEWATVGGKSKLMTPAEIRAQDAQKPLSASESMDARKFQKAAPVLAGIGELSEKINTQQGLIAKMAGGASRVAAEANYNDDVAEYQALVSGFTPMIARALGHTGVLTQQDVDSVKALFPQPGNSKTLRDRKINRMMSIISDLEGATSGTPRVAPPAAGGGISYQDYLNAKKPKGSG